MQKSPKFNPTYSVTEFYGHDTLLGGGLDYILEGLFHMKASILNSISTLLGPSLAEVKSVCLECGRPGFSPWVGKIPWRRKWQPTPVLLLGESHGGRSLVGYSLWGCKESDTTERLHFL